MMDNMTKIILNEMFQKHYSKVYKSKPELKTIEDTNYFYTSSEENNIICLLPLEYKYNA